MLIVLYADVSRLDTDGEYILSDYRRERLSRTRPPDKRRQSIGAELLLNRAAALYAPDIALPLDIVCNDSGKPELSGKRFFFSLSHSGAYAAAAVSDREAGLDIQTISHADRGLTARFFASDEQEYILHAKSSDAAFTELWCKKESYIKALGAGLSLGLASFSVMNMRGLWYTELEGFSLAVCVPGAETEKPDILKKIEL